MQRVEQQYEILADIKQKAAVGNPSDKVFGIYGDVKTMVEDDASDRDQ